MACIARTVEERLTPFKAKTIAAAQVGPRGLTAARRRGDKRRGDFDDQDPMHGRRTPLYPRTPRARASTLIGAAVSAAAILMAGCQAPPAQGPDAVRLVSSLVRTGSANAQTGHIVHGIRLALSQANYRAGTIPLTYADWDDASTKKGDWDPEVEAANAARAVADRRVAVYLGPYNSGAAKISAPILNRGLLASISPVVTYPGLTRASAGELHEPQVYRPSGRVTFFRVVPTDDIQGAVGARWMQAMGGRSVYVLDDLQLYGHGVAEVFVDAARAAGLTVLGHDGVDGRAQEYRSLMAKIRALDPDWIYYGGTTQTNAGQIIKDAAAAGVRAKIMLPDGCFEEALIDAAGAHHANERVYLTFGGVPPEALTGVGADFVADYQRAYHTRPDVYGVYGYVAAQAAIEAVRLAGGADRERVRAAMARVQMDGPLGSWHFDGQGDISRSALSGNIVRGGRFVFLQLLDAAGAP